MFYQSKLKTVVIPANATTIGNSAFEQCASLISIDIPANVETIGTAVFWGCSSLTTVTFEKGSQLKTIGGGSSSYYGAFSYCTALTSIEIPASVETIGASAFKGCSKLATVTFEKESQLKTIGGGYSEPNYYGVFSDCTALTSIEIPASVETIEAAAFLHCSRLADVKFEEGSKLSAIEGYCCGYGCYGAFLGCPLITIDIPASVQTIGEAAFQECTKLATVRFEHNSQLKSIEGGYYRSSSGSDYFSGPIGAFYRLPNLRTVDMSNCTQVESIGGYAFYGNSELRLVKIGTPTPPTCDQAAFGVNPQSVLKVPTGCADAYKAAIGWRGFTSITGLDE